MFLTSHFIEFLNSLPTVWTRHELNRGSDCDVRFHTHQYVYMFYAARELRCLLRPVDFEMFVLKVKSLPQWVCLEFTVLAVKLLSVCVWWWALCINSFAKLYMWVQPHTIGECMKLRVRTVCCGKTLNIINALFAGRIVIYGVENA